MAKSEGGCLCGAVRFRVAAAPREIGVCHCGMCRRWGGGLPFAGVEAEVSVQDDGKLRWWRSSSWGERGFCSECGCSLFWRANGNEKGWAVSVGALDDQSELRITKHIFIDDKEGFYALADDAECLTGAQFMAHALLRMSAQMGEEILPDALEQSRAQHGEEFVEQVRRHIEELQAQSAKPPA